MADEKRGAVYYKADDYYHMAVQLEKDMPDNIKEAFKVISGDIKMSGLIRQMMFTWAADEVRTSEHYDGTFSLTNLIWYLLFTDCSQKDFDEGFKQISKNRLNKKSYFVTKTQRELDKKKGTLYTAASEYMSYRFDGNKEYQSRDEFARAYLEKVKEWAGGKNSDLIDFPLSAFLAPSKRLNDFLSDLSYRMFDTIREMYNSNPVNGYRTRLPKKLMDGAAFSGYAHETEADLDYSFDRNRVVASEKRDIVQPDGTSIKTERIAGVASGVFNVPQTEAEEKKVLSELKATNGFNIQNFLPDATDQAILVYIYSSFTIDNLVNGVKYFKLSDIVRNLGKRQSQKSYARLVRRLDSLLKYRLNYTTYTEKGSILETGDINLFTRIGFRDDSILDPLYNVNMQLLDDTSDSGYVKNLETQDLSNFSVAIELSPFLRDSMVKALNEGIVNQIDVNILTRDYKSINPEAGSVDRVRNILMILQEERTAIYPEKEVRLDYRFFSQRLHLEKFKTNRLKKILDEAFSYLRDNATILSDYALRDYSITLDFLPFSQEELELLSIPKRTVL